VVVRSRGEPERSLLSIEVEPRRSDQARSQGDHLLAERSVDLGEYAERSVELVLGAEGGHCSTLQWVSPIVRYRRGLRRPRVERPNIVLIGADTLRADAVGPWRESASLTPALDRFASSSDVFLEAYSSNNSTNPSFASLMTGLYSKDHGVFDLTTPLADAATTLSELLSSEGYRTMGVVSVRHLGEFSGLRQGFDELLIPAGQLFAETTVNLAMSQIAKAPEPFFSWIHLFDPHVPQTPPEPFDQGYRPREPYGLGTVADWIEFRSPGARSFLPQARPQLLGHPDLYGGEVAYLDRQVDRLLDFLESRGLFERSIVVFVADHGETIGEHGFYFDHVGLWDATVHVPLMIHWPGQREGRRLDALVQHLDLFTTLLKAAGIDAPRNEGIDLRALADGDRGRPAVFAHDSNDMGEMVRTKRYKYYRQRLPAFVEVGDYLYDLAQDPREQNNLAGAGSAQQKVFQDLLERWRGSGHPQRRGPSLDLSESARRELEALGYVQ
jgi:arylsulfatase A-like enzyme